MADEQTVDLDMCERGNNLFVTDDGNLFLLQNCQRETGCRFHIIQVITRRLR